MTFILYEIINFFPFEGRVGKCKNKITNRELKGIKFNMFKSFAYDLHFQISLSLSDRSSSYAGATGNCYLNAI